MSHKGIVYTETVVHAAPTRFVADAPYQLAIVDLDDGDRRTVRILGERVRIGDRVEFAEDRDGVAFFQLSVVSSQLSVPEPTTDKRLLKDRELKTDNWELTTEN